MLYLKAIDLVYAGNEPKVVIDNSLNKGFYTIIEGVEPTEELAALIESQMRRLVAEDMPVIKEVFTKEEGIKLWEESGYSEKADLLKNTADKINKAVFYNMDGYRNYFYGPMVPSAGYIEYFQVMPYGEGFLLRYPYYSNPSEIPTYVDEFKLFEAFAEERKWLGLLRANYLSDLNAIVRSGKYEDMILLTEALHEKRIAEIADMIKEQKKRIILIAGPSSSGKTTTCRRLCIQLRVNGLEPVYLGTDDYFVNREETPLDEKGEKDYESIKALDLKLFNEHMKALLKGEEVDIPEFDFI